MARAACAATGSESALKPHRDFAVPVDGYQVDAVECAAIAKFDDLIAGGLYSSRPVLSNALNQGVRVVAASRRVIAALARTMTPAYTGASTVSHGSGDFQPESVGSAGRHS